MTDQRKIFQIIRRGDIDVYKTIIKKYDINILNESGYSLLHIAIARRQYEIALDLVNRNIDLNLRDKKGQTCLHYLGFYQNVELTRAILEKGADLGIRDAYGNTPLWYAVFYARENYDLVILYIKNKADPNSINKVGRSPLMFATQIKDQKLIQLLTTSKD
jgi:uncharacterized protein